MWFPVVLSSMSDILHERTHFCYFMAWEKLVDKCHLETTLRAAMRIMIGCIVANVHISIVTTTLYSSFPSFLIKKIIQMSFKLYGLMVHYELCQCYQTYS